MTTETPTVARGVDAVSGSDFYRTQYEEKRCAGCGRWACDGCPL